MEALLGITMTVVMAIIGWAFNVHGRISVMESRYEDLVKLIESKFDDLDARLERMERKMWNGGSHS